MSRKTDVLVIGSGLAGLFAALAAANKGAKTKLVFTGQGCLAISGGIIDLLGYDDAGKRIADPFAALTSLPEGHPYALAGADNVKRALEAFREALRAAGLEYKSAADDGGKPCNVLAPTIMGTLKPTFLYDSLQSPELLPKAKKALVISAKGFRECRSRLVISQLRRYPELEAIDFAEHVLPAPFPEYGRSLSPLDLAHFLDTEQGLKWAGEKLANLGSGYDLVLLPPILGARPDSRIRLEAQRLLGAPFVEMQSTPPGVQGLRLRRALIKQLEDKKVEFYENAEAKSAKIENGSCASVTSVATNRVVEHAPGAVVLATGGVLSGGLALDQGSCVEPVFGIPIPVPADVEEWSSRDVFGRHLISSLGLKTDSSLRPVAEGGEALMDNVFVAGRTLGGYDYAREKSGAGVAVATGWLAGENAAAKALENGRKTSGAAE